MEALFAEFALASGVVDTRQARDLQAADDLYSKLLPHQQQLIDDPHRRKSALCPRRAGKTFAVLYYAFITCLRRPGARVALITLTQKSGKRNYWRLLRQLDSDYGLGLKFLDTTTEVFFENGSYLFLSGAETLTEVEKFRGDQYDLAIIDECKSFSDRILLELLDDALAPALSDRLGSAILIGTPGTVCAGTFFLATSPGSRSEGGILITRMYDGTPPGELYEWSAHSWTQKDNTAVPAIWEEALRIKAVKGWSDDNPTWRREFLGQWVSGEAAQVFVYASRLVTGSVTWTPALSNTDNPFGLPAGHTWEYVLGLDLGFEDDTALVVLAYALDLRYAFAVWDYRSKHLTATPLAAIINQIQRRVGRFAGMVADTGGGASRMLVETLNAEHGFAFDAASKTEKYDHIELLNSDLYDGLVKLNPDSDLAREVEVLQWDLSDGNKHELARKGKLRYSLACQDHLSDAFLYAWRFLQHRHAALKAPPGPVVGSAEWAKGWDAEERA
ncbi:MAG: terminase large subunit domain-containing protein, partial [Anaerolineales bacterium]